MNFVALPVQSRRALAVLFTCFFACLIGTMIAGSLDDAIEANDVWTFSRVTNAAGPDWLLDETDEA